jgi:hypothetical protein
LKYELNTYKAFKLYRGRGKTMSSVSVRRGKGIREAAGNKHMYSPHFTRKSMGRGGGGDSGAFEGEVFWWVD